MSSRCAKSDNIKHTKKFASTHLLIALACTLCFLHLSACHNLESSYDVVKQSSLDSNHKQVNDPLQQVALIGAKAAVDKTENSPEKYHFFQEIMGTHFQVQILAFDRQTALAAARASFNEARRIEHLMSSWRNQSEIGKLNQQVGLSSVNISYETAWLLCEAKRLSSLTRGSFDVTWASLKGLWNFKNKMIPEHEVLLKRLKTVGSKFIEIEIKDKNGITQPCKALASKQAYPVWTRFEEHAPPQWFWTYKAQLLHPQSQIDLGGIAKGFAVDNMARLLKRLGYTDFIVDGGGDLLVFGRDQDQKPWQVGIQHPRHETLWGSLWVPSDWSVVTSGDYERFFYHNEQRYHHIIDLRTGYPAQGSVAMTVIAQNALLADVMATALFILGPYEGIALADSISGVEAICFAPNGEIVLSHGAHVFSPNLPTRWK